MRRFFFNLICLLVVSFSCPAHTQTSDQLLRTPRTKLLEKANDFKRKELTDSALKYYVALSAVYSPSFSEDDKRMCSLGALEAGDIYYSYSMYVPAFDSYMRAVKMAEKCGAYIVAGKAYKGIGNISASFNDNLQAIECYRKGLEHARVAGDHDTEYKLLVNLSVTCAYENMNTEALRYYNQMKCYAGSSPSTPYFQKLIEGILNSYSGRCQAALADYDSAYRYAIAKNMNPEYICATYSEKAKAYKKEGNLQKAIDGYLECAAYARQKKIYSMLSESLECLGKLYSETGNHAESKKHTSSYLALKDSLIAADQHNRIKNEQFAYEMERSYNDITRLNSEVAEKK